MKEIQDTHLENEVLRRVLVDQLFLSHQIEQLIKVEAGEPVVRVEVYGGKAKPKKGERY